jgi:hypothetical protein
VIDHAQFIRLHACVIQWREVAAVVLDGERVIVTLRSGREITFSGGEAAEVWRAFDPDTGWQQKE